MIEVKRGNMIEVKYGLISATAYDIDRSPVHIFIKVSGQSCIFSLQNATLSILF